MKNTQNCIYSTSDKVSDHLNYNTNLWGISEDKTLSSVGKCNNTDSSWLYWPGLSPGKKKKPQCSARLLSLTTAKETVFLCLCNHSNQSIYQGNYYAIHISYQRKENEQNKPVKKLLNNTVKSQNLIVPVFQSLSNLFTTIFGLQSFIHFWQITEFLGFICKY